jgi:hypothetical protein
MLKHFKTIIMAFKVINDFKECITNIINSNLKTKIKREGVCAHWTPPLHQSLKVYPAMIKLILSMNSLLLFSWFLASFQSQIDLDSPPSFLNHNLCHLSFFSILHILLISMYLLSLFLYDFLYNFSQILLVCSRTTFYKLNKTRNGKTMVVLLRVC